MRTRTGPLPRATPLKKELLTVAPAVAGQLSPGWSEGKWRGRASNEVVRGDGAITLAVRKPTIANKTTSPTMGQRRRCRRRASLISDSALNVGASAVGVL